MFTLASLALTAYLGTAPITIVGCSTEPLFQTVSTGDIMTEQQSGSQLHIRFVNAGPKTIASVTFAVSDAGTTQNVIDAGTFSTGASISHAFNWWSYTADSVDCHVVSVRYADGTTG